MAEVSQQNKEMEKAYQGVGESTKKSIKEALNERKELEESIRQGILEADKEKYFKPIEKRSPEFLSCNQILGILSDKSKLPVFSKTIARARCKANSTLYCSNQEKIYSDKLSLIEKQNLRIDMFFNSWDWQCNEMTYERILEEASDESRQIHRAEKAFADMIKNSDLLKAISCEVPE